MNRRWYLEEVMAFLARAPNSGLQRIQIGIGGWIVEGLGQEGQVLQGLRRAPGFSMLAVMALPLGIAAVRGRLFLPEESQPGRGRVAILSHEDARGLGQLNATLGTAVTLEGTDYEVIGSLAELGQVDPGFESRNRVTARIGLPTGLPEDPEAQALCFAQVQEALVQSPELTDVALASAIPFGTEWESLAVFIPGVTEDPNNLRVVRQRRASAD